MKTEAIDYCLKIFDHWNDHDSEMRDEVIFGGRSFLRMTVVNFGRELNQNLSNCKTQQEKGGVIKYYILELKKAANIVVDYQSLGIPEEVDKDLDVSNVVINSRIELKVIIQQIQHYFYMLLFNEIQDNCYSYSIDFLSICNELHFLLPTIKIQSTHLDNQVKIRVPTENPDEDEWKNKPTLSVILTETQNGQIKKTDEKPNPEFILFELEKLENQFWKGLPMDVVVDHFKVLTSTKNRNGEYFLSIEQLISFLKKGFLKDANQKKQKINCTIREKGFVIKLFYEFFFKAVGNFGCLYKKEKFINLFTECFDNWDQISVTYFFKPNIVKRNW